MNEQLSAMIDGEVDDDALNSVYAAMGHDVALQEHWAMYHMIGDALRDEGYASSRVSERVFAALNQEPTVLAPQRKQHRGGERTSTLRQRAAYSLAASVAGIAFVGLLVWQGGGNHVASHATDNVAQVDASKVQMPVQTQVQLASTDATTVQQQRMGRYWLAHRQLSGHMTAQQDQDGDIHFASVQVPQEAR